MSLRRGRQYYRSYPCFRLGISIHASTRGTTAFVASCFPTAKFQSTSPRGGRQVLAAGVTAERAISIHVPTRGTTSSLCLNFGIKKISIHVPTRGTTPPKPPQPPFIIIFQSTSPRGGRPEEVVRQLPAVRISIHVPTRGTTLPPLYRPGGARKFQSTSPRGGRRYT